MRAPCLIGWAQVSRFAGEPLEAWSEALTSTGVDPAVIDSLDVVYCQSWPYDDPAGRLATRVGASPRRQAYSGIGGTTPFELLDAAAQRIVAGDAEVCAIVGGEALAQVRAAKMAGERLAWSFRDLEKKPFPFEAPFHPAEVAHQVFQAYSTFALRDIARRAHVGATVADHRRSLGDLFAPMTKVAASNPHAWFRRESSIAELTEVSTENRMVAFPYTKRLVAAMDVDLSAAVVLASAAAADRLGIAEDERIHLRGWSEARDPVYVAEHDELWRSPAMHRVLPGALATAGMDIDDVTHLDLYSCFPSSVSFGLDALGLTAEDRLAPFTVTGGLPYAGGAGSNYGLSSLAAMADRLRRDPGIGLASGVGMHMTKHVACVLANEPGKYVAPADGREPGGSSGPVCRPVVDVHHGDATIAAYTVHHGRDGAVTDALVIADVQGTAAGDGARCYARAEDPDLLSAMEIEEWVGRPVRLTEGPNGVNLLVAAR